MNDDNRDRIAAELRANDPEAYDRVAENLANMPSIDDLDLDPLTAAELIVESEAEVASGSIRVPGYPYVEHLELGRRLAAHGGTAVLEDYPQSTPRESDVVWRCERYDVEDRDRCAEVFEDWCHEYGLQ
jgi:hypothetical protein